MELTFYRKLSKAGKSILLSVPKDLHSHVETSKLYKVTIEKLEE